MEPQPDNTTTSETVRPFYNQNGYTELNNYVLDYIMPKLSPNAWKVLCFIIRKTKGWQKEQDQLSFSQIMEGTGIKNRTTVSSAIDDLESGNYVYVIHSSDRVTSNTYSLNTDLEINLGSTEIVLPSTEIGLGVVQKSDTQKKGLNKHTTHTPPAQEEENLPQTKHQELQTAILDVCMVAISRENQAAILRATNDAKTKKHTPVEIQAFGKWWREEDWRGKRGSPPSLGQIVSEWPQYEQFKKYGPPKQNGANNGTRKIPSQSTPASIELGQQLDRAFKGERTLKGV